MKKIFSILSLLLFVGLSSHLLAQTEQHIPYQAVLMTEGQPVALTDLLVRFTLLDGEQVLYQEEHPTRTSASGLFSIDIGTGTVIFGTWEMIRWDAALNLRVEINAGDRWQLYGQSRLGAAPMSMYAETAGAVAHMRMGDLSDVNIDAQPDPGQILRWNGSHWIATADALADNDDDPTNELQTLSLEGHVLTLSGQGGSITLPTADPAFASVDSGLAYVSGRVGIGTASPQSDLHLTGSLLGRHDSLTTGYQLRWDTDKAAFRAGVLEAGEAGLWEPANMGEASFAVNRSTQATGDNSAAFGDQSQANGNNAFAGGLGSVANADGSFAFGYTNYATGLRTTVFGQSSMAIGDYSYAAGFGAQARSRSGYAFGEGVVSSSRNSIALGRYNVGTGNETQWMNDDPILEVGIGTGPTDRRNAWIVLKNGKTGIAPGVHAPSAQLEIFQQSDTLGGGLKLTSGRQDSWELVTRHDGHLAYYQNDVIRASVDPNTGAWIQLSDFRLKEDIHPMEAGLQELLRLEPHSYQYIFGKQQTWGFIAQDVQALFPHLVRQQGDMLGISYQELSVLAIKAIQDQQEIIDVQQARINDLEKRLRRIEQIMEP